MKLTDLLANDTKYLTTQGGCYSCPRAKKGFVPATLRDSAILFVGEAPGATEVETGEGFTGASGQLLRELLDEVGITNFSLTNTIHCRPPGNRDPSPKEISCCLNQFVLSEINQYPIIVMVGNVATKSFFHTKHLTYKELRGNVARHPDFPGKRFYTIYHPAYVLRRQDQRPILKRQLERLKRIAEEDTVDFEIFAEDSDLVLSKLRDYLAGGRISFDIETRGEKTAPLHPWVEGGAVRSMAIAGATDEAVFVREEEPHWQEAKELVRDFLKTPNVVVMGHHVGFDIDYLEHDMDFKSPSPRVLETGALYYQLRHHQQIGLKELTSLELDGYRYLCPDPSREKDPTVLKYYNAEDVIYPWRLVSQGLAELRSISPRTLDLFVRVSGPSDLALTRLTSTGVHFYVDRWMHERQIFAEERAQVLRDWQEEDPAFQPGMESGKKLEKYIFETKNLPVISTTKKGKAQINAASIKEWIRSGHTELEHLLAFRKVDKNVGTYVEPFEGHLYPDGRIHPGYRHTTTDSGRTSSLRPNYQNQPRNRVRSFFGAPPGWRFGESDFSQIELRIMMCLARDPVGMAAYLRGDDLHTETATHFAEEPNKEQRTWAKAINFALIYGGDWYTVQRYARDVYGIEFTETQAREFTDVFFNEKYRNIKPTIEFFNKELVQKRGHAESIVGHRFYYKNWDHEDQKIREHEHRAHVNSKAQGPAGYMCLYTLWKAQCLAIENNIPINFVGEVHDSIHYEFREGAERDVLLLLEEAVGLTAQWVAPWFTVPLVMEHEFGTPYKDGDPSSGNSWWEKKEVTLADFPAAA